MAFKPRDCGGFKINEIETFSTIYFFRLFGDHFGVGIISRAVQANWFTRGVECAFFQITVTKRLLFKTITNYIIVAMLMNRRCQKLMLRSTIGKCNLTPGTPRDLKLCVTHIHMQTQPNNNNLLSF